MRKQSKSLISMILAAAMVVSLGTGTGTSNKASAEDTAAKTIEPAFEAYLCTNGDDGKVFDYTAVTYENYKDSNGNPVQFSVAASTGAITQTGTYTLEATVIDPESLEDPTKAVTSLFDTKKGTSYLAVQFGELGSTKVGDDTNFKLPDSYSIKPKEIRIKHADGSADTVLDWSSATVFNEGNSVKKPLRIGITNKYDNSKSGAAYDSAVKSNPFWELKDNAWKEKNDPVTIAKGDVFSATFEVTGEAPTITPTPVPTAEPTAPPAAKSYKAYLGFQTDNFVFRDPWNKTESNENYKHDTQICVAETKARAVDAKMTNVDIKENTTYTVAIAGVNLKTMKNVGREEPAGMPAELAKQFNMVYVDTNIPLAMKGVSAVNATLKIDGKVVKSGMTLPCKPDADGYYQLMVADAYSEDDGIKNVPYPKANALKTLPTESIEITFTMKGINFQQDFSKKTIGVKKGKTFSSGNFKYKVTKAATMTAGQKKQGTVTVVGLTKKGKSAKSLSVGKTVSKTVSKVKATYKINKLGSNACKGAKAKSVTLSKNIKSIPKGAFAKCKNLSTLTLKAKISVKKGAFKGCKKTIKVKGTSKKANLKKLKKCGYKKFK